MEKNDRENMDVEKRENRAVTESLTRIKGEAFCERTVLCIPRHFTRIGEEAFPGKSEDRTVRGTEDRDLYRGACILWLQCIKTGISPGTLEKLGKGCFAECPTLQEVYIPSSLRRLPEAVFQSDVELKNIHFIKESQLIFIDANAFQGCKKLEHIEIPDSIRKIGDWAFCKCKKLQEFRFPKELVTIGKKAFSGCNIRKLHLPDKLCYIGEDAFSKNHYLREVVLPESVKSIENGAFRSCIRLQAVEIRHDPEVLGERIVNGNTAIRCYPGSKVEEYCKAAGIRWSICKENEPRVRQ